MAHDAKFGALIDEHQQRDAIHLAITPVIATERLYPGDHVGLVDDTEHVGKTAPGITPIGIIDPFLLNPVEKGERCWLLLYQQTITSLRHDWTHPAFVPVVAEKSSKETSEAWLRAFVQTSDCPGYETVIAAAVDGGDGCWNDEYLHFSGSDAHGDIPPEFWDHVEIVTGRKITKRATSFSCSC